MFWEKFYKLCIERGTSPNAVCAELKFSNATATKWKKGSVPGTDSLNKIAVFFGVSVEYFLGKEKSPVVAGLKEKHLRLITAYDRAETPIQEAVDRLLKIDEKPIIVKIAARDGSFEEREITKEEWNKINNLPDAEL